MTNVFTALSDVLLPRCYGQVMAALVARAVVLLALMILSGCASLLARQSAPASPHAALGGCHGGEADAQAEGREPLA